MIHDTKCVLLVFSPCSTARSRLYAKNVGAFITNIAISKLVGEYIYYSSC